jgi:diguanylate cyclase (GGDEF)-like protein
MFDSTNYILPEESLKFLLKQECERAERYSHFFSILMVKLEVPKLDDPLLSTAANLIRGAIRDSDIMGTLQDKNLVVILHHADAQSTDEIAMRIGHRIQEYAHRFPQDSKGRKIKVGAACFPTHAPTAQDLLRAAQERSSEPNAYPN